MIPYFIGVKNLKNNLKSIVKMRFSRILINRSNNFSLILLSDVEGGAGLIPDRKGYFKAQANIQTIYNPGIHTTEMRDLIYKTIIHTSKKIVSGVSTNTAKMENIVATITFWNKRRRNEIVVGGCEIVALSLNSCTPDGSRETISKYIEELFLAEVQSRQGIMADNVWLELKTDIDIKMTPPKLVKLLRSVRKINNLIFFFKGRPHWKHNIISLV
jgi:hypothetical protein